MTEQCGTSTPNLPTFFGQMTDSCRALLDKVSNIPRSRDFSLGSWDRALPRGVGAFGQDRGNSNTFSGQRCPNELASKMKRNILVETN